MLKYKCVKRYPNGPDIGTIVTKDALGQYVQEHPLWIHSWEEIENFTEFWEEVKEVKLEVPIGTKFTIPYGQHGVFTIKSIEEGKVHLSWEDGGTTIGYDIADVNKYFKEGHWVLYKKKEFEILEFKVSYDDRIIKLNSDGSYSSDGGIPASLDIELQWVKNGTRIISKVKRLSDGVVFSVGDLIDGFSYQNRIIKGFEIEDNSLRVLQEGGFSRLERIKHSAKPLFLDELGNGVFEGDKVFSVCYKYNWEIEDNRSVNKASKFVQDNYKEQAAWKYFKYKEDRDNYVLENKPMFSKKQILDAVTYAKQIYSRCDIIPEERFIEKLGL